MKDNETRKALKKTYKALKDLKRSLEEPQPLWACVELVEVMENILDTTHKIYHAHQKLASDSADSDIWLNPAWDAQLIDDLRKWTD